MKNIYLILLIFAILFSIQSCDDCPLEPANPQELCETRIVTIEQFNANYTEITNPINGTISTILDSNYNIGMFLFPAEMNSSGSFPNDVRFENSFQIPIARVPINSNEYSIAILDRMQSNSYLAGDILVSNVLISTIDNYADLRVSGKIRLLKGTLFSEDSEVFCNFIKANREAIKNDITPMPNDQTFQYGANYSDKNEINYAGIVPSIINSNGEIIGKIGDPNMPTVPAEALNNLLIDASNKKAIDIRVRPGQLFAYISKDGKRFVFLVSEIRTSSIAPFRKRVTIMFSPLD